MFEMSIKNNYLTLLSCSAIVIWIVFHPLTVVAENNESSGSDWIYINQGCISSCLGVFHDKTSGAFVGLEIGITGMPAEFAPLVAKKENSSVITVSNEGKNYQMVSVEEKRKLYINNTCPSDQIDSPKGIVVSYTDKKESKTWNFTAIACNPNQRQRIESLITQTQWPDVISFSGHSEIGSVSTEKLKIGTSWNEVRNSFGNSLDPVANRGGFVIMHRTEKESKKTNVTWLFFDQQRILQKITDIDPEIPVYPGLKIR